MSETLRDLVVSLSLQTDNFTRNIKSVNKQIKEAEANFKLAASGFEGFEDTVQGMQSKLALLEKKFKLQNEVVDQYEKALAAASIKLQECYDRQETYNKTLEQAKNRQETLRQAVSAIEQEFTSYTQTLGDNDEKTIECYLRLEAYKDRLREADAAVTLLEGQSGALQKATISASDAFTTANTNLIHAKTAASETASQLDALKEKMEIFSFSETENSFSMIVEDANKELNDLESELKKAESEFNLASSGSDSFETSLAGLEAQLILATTKLNLQNKAVDTQERVLKSASGLLNTYKTAQQKNNEQLNEAKANYDAIQKELEDTQSKYELLNGVYGESDSVVIQYRESVEALRKKLQEAEAAITPLEQKNSALETAIDSASASVRNAETDLNNAKAEVKNTQTEIENLSGAIEAMPWTSAGESLQAFADKCKGIGESLEDVGNKLTNTVTRTIVNAGKDIVSSSAEWETAWTGVRARVRATEEQYAELQAGVIALSETIGMSKTDIAEVVQTAGQLGIPTESILGFTRAMIDFGKASVNLEANDAATIFARFSNIMDSDQSVEYFQRLGSAASYLGNNMATTEAEIMEMALRIAGAGKTVGMSEAQILAFAGALSSLGIESQAGGSSISKMFVNIGVAVAGASTNLDEYRKALLESGYSSEEVEEMIATTETSVDKYAEVAGMTAEQFSALWKEDPSQAFVALLEGIQGSDDSLVTLSETLGITEIRLRDTMQRLSGSGDSLETALKSSEDAWNSNTSLVELSSGYYDTAATKIANLEQKINNLKTSFGEVLLPVVEQVVGAIGDVVEKFNELDADTKGDILKAALIAAAIGPALNTVGNTITVVGKVSEAIGKVSTKVGEIIANSGGWRSALSGIFGSSAFWGIAAAGGAAVGITLLLQYLDEIPSKTEQIITDLSDIKITVNQESVQQALDSIGAVQEAADKLSGLNVEEREKMSTTSEAVKLGYGTSSMYGTSLGYESALAEEQIKTTTEKYTALLSEQKEAVISAVNAGDEAAAEAARKEMVRLESEMSSEISGIKTSYSQAVSDLFNGMVKQYPELAANLEQASKEYDLVSLMYQWLNFDAEAYAKQLIAETGGTMLEEEANANAATYAATLAEQAQELAESLGYETSEVTTTWMESIMGDVTGSLASTVELLSANPTVNGFMQTILDSTVSESLDYSLLQGALDGTVSALDFKHAADMAIENNQASAFGDYLVQGLAVGIKENASAIRPSVTEVRDQTVNALQDVFDMHSPSKLMEEYGQYITQGIEQGMISRDPSGTTASVASRIRYAMSTNLRYNEFYGIGRNAMQGVIAGINSKTSDLYYTMAETARQMVVRFKQELKIESPSKVFRDEVGVMIMQGIGSGITSQTAEEAAIISNAARNLVNSGQQASVVNNNSTNNNQRTYNQQSTVNVNVEQLAVRDEQDVQGLAREIATLTKRNQQGKGLRYV